MRITVLIVLACLLAITSAAVVDALHAQAGPRTCEAPCTVVFPAGTEEDEFKIDYAQAKLRVWKGEPR